MRTILLLAFASLALAACAEREQTASGIKSDTEPYAGTSKQAPYMAEGWKPGDRTAWEQQMKVRTVQGQNDYAKME